MKTAWMTFPLLIGTMGMVAQQPAPLKKIIKGGKSEVKITIKKEALPLTLNDVLRSLESPEQVFHIQAQRDTVLKGKNGTLLYYYGNSLCDDQGNPVKGQVSLKLKESFEYWEMMGDRLSTETDSGFLETRGMVKLGANTGNKKLKLRAGSELTVMVPNKLGSGGMQVWQPNTAVGQRSSANITSWQTPNPVGQFNPSSYVSCGWTVPDRLVKKCNFWCKVRRFFGIKTLSQTSRRTLTLRAEYWSPLGCAGLDSLVKKYNIQNYQQLFTLVYAPLMKQYKVSTLKQLFYRMEQERRVNVEKSLASGNTSFQNLNYYVFSTSELNWRNLDEFYHMSDDMVVEQKIDEPVKPETSVSLVFKSRKIIVSAYVDPDKRYHYPRVPKDEEGTVVAIKVWNGKPMLAVQPVKFGEKEIDLDFKVVTLDELKQGISKAGL